VIGLVERTGPFTLNKAYAFGNPGVALNFTAGTPPSTIVVWLSKLVPSGLKFGLARTYTISAAGGSGFSANLRLHYLPADLHGLNSSTLCLWKYNTGSSTWTKLPVSTSNLNEGWVETSGVTSFSLWGLASTNGYVIDLPFLRR